MPTTNRRTARTMVALADDTRLAIRSLSRSPGFAFTGIAIFAFGLAAAALAFSIIRAVLLAPLPYDRPAGLFQAMIRRLDDAGGFEGSVVSRPVFEAWQSARTARAVASNEARHESTLYLTSTAEPERVRGSLVSTPYFALLGVRAARGRSFVSEDAGRPVAVISDGLWRRAFGADPAVIGSHVGVNGREHTIIGVTAPDFMAPPPVFTTDVDEAIEVWLPLGPDPATRDFDRVIIRVADGTAVPEVEAELARLARGVGIEDVQVRLVPLEELFTRDARTGMRTLALTVLLALVIACANIGAVQITRLAGRHGEISIRSALGAGRLRVFGHLLSEGMVLALAGGALAVLLAAWAQTAVRAITPPGLLRMDRAAIDLVVVAFTVVSALACGAVATIWPAAVASALANPSVASARIRGAGSNARSPARELLVFVQIAVALALCAGTGAVVRSLVRLMSVETGVITADVMVADLHRRRNAAGAVDARNFHDEALRRVSELPGVRSASLASSVPFRPRDYYGPDWRTRVISPTYLETLGIRVVHGRGFDDRDVAVAEPVALVSESLARSQFGVSDAVGRTIDERTIVGVVADIHHESLDLPPEPALYIPLAQRSDDRLSLLVAATGATGALAARIRDVVREIDPDQPVEIRRLDQIIERSTAVSRRRFPARVLGLLAVFAAVLAALGVYGVTAQTTHQRAPEIGIRVTLGATGNDVLRLVLVGGTRVVIGGLAAGLVLSLVFTRLLSGVLFQADVFDPFVLATAAAVLGTAALVAMIAPARRALRIDPAVVLRRD